MATPAPSTSQPTSEREVLAGAFFWLSAFYFVYCARPEEWIPGLTYIPVAKIAGGAAFLGLVASAGKTKRRFKNLPREANYLLALIAILFISAFLSPVWKGGAFWHTIEFAKVYVAFVLTYLLTTSFRRLRRLIFIQSGSVAMITAVSLLKGHDRPRLDGVIGGIYSNPNDLAFAIVLALPFCLAFLVSAKSALYKLAWGCAMLIMAVALFLTASRAGFIDLAVAGTVCLWNIGVKGRRFHLVVGTILIGAIIFAAAGRQLKDRFEAISGEGLETDIEGRAYGSFEGRLYLMRRALEGIEHYPILGIGVNNFTSYSLAWHEVHMAYLQIAVEGGIGALILYLLFFYCGFSNLRKLRKVKTRDPDYELFAGALHSSLTGFAVGACFAPEAYHFFPYFAVAFTSVMLAVVREQQDLPAPGKDSRAGHWRSSPEPFGTPRTPETITIGS